LNLVLVRIWEEEEGKTNIIREVAVGKVAAHLGLTLVVKELKISVEQGNNTKI
jgi:hypothetical protein